MKRIFMAVLFLGLFLSVNAAVTHSTAVRCSVLTYEVGLLDSANFPYIVLQATNGDSLAVGTLPNPAFSVSTITATGASLPWTITGAVAGTIAKGKLCKKNGNIVWNFSASTSGADCTVDNTSVTKGQTITISAFTITAAP